MNVYKGCIKKRSKGTSDLNAFVQFDECNQELKSFNKQQEAEALTIARIGDLGRKLLYKERENIIQTIPTFWYHAILGDAILKQLFKIQKCCLKYLLSVEVNELVDFADAFRIMFYFKPNPYFDNTILVKEIYPYI